MKSSTYTFNIAYDFYYKTIQQNKRESIAVLEIGGGAFPSINDREGLKYAIIDPDEKELSKAPSDVLKIHSAIEEYNQEQKFDLIISKMVLEHIKEPDFFHKKVLNFVKPNGRIIHFFACKYSLPGLVNRILPESWGEKILKALGNRNTDEFPKYPAYYKRTKGGVISQLNYFKKLGFEIESYTSFVGHKYFRSIPILNQLEQLFTKLLVVLNLKSFATVALVVLKKNNHE